MTAALNWRSEGQVHYEFDATDALEWFERWAIIRDQLRASDPDLDDLPVRAPPELAKSEYGTRQYVHRDDLSRLWRDMEDAWDVLNHPSRQVAQVSLDREGIFVAGQPFDAMVAVTSIIRTAATSLVVIDGYISERTLDLLTVKDDTVTVRVLTYKTNPALVQHAKTFQAQYGGLELRTSQHFHDRFLIVDDTEHYHFGHSIKDAAVKNTFMFSRIEEPSVIATLQAAFATQWASATRVQL